VLVFFTLLWAGYRMRVHQLQEQEKKFRDAIETMRPWLSLSIPGVIALL
jgi:hypothetical protein